VLASKYFDVDASWSFGISIPLRVAALPSEANIRLQAADLFKAPTLQKNGIKKFLFSDLKKDETENVERSCDSHLHYPGKTLT
jgi:hypothetical protein